MDDPRDFIWDELTINRNYYKELVSPFKNLRDQLIDQEDNLLYEVIMENYLDTIISVITQDMTERFPLNVEDLLIVLEESDLINFLEPEN